ncbi:MAG: hypothetical protein LBI13_09190, partial [Streptococcaceae bacterium]|nr:hypothetical protein [Streptococcaceae bacterium]
MNFKKTIVKTSLVLLGTLALSLLLTSPTLASTVGTTPVNTATTSSTSSKTPAVTTQPVVLTTAEQAAALAHTTGTQVTPPETVTIDPSVTSSGTVVDETKNTSATSGTTSPTTTGNTGTTGTSSSATTGGTVSPTPSSTRTVNPLISLSPNQDPKINSIKVTGSINNDMTGSGVMDNVEVTIDSKNIKADNLLTPDGLHWSSDTTVVPIHETALGTISDQNFPVDGPTIPATAYTFNPGDSGRITDVGQTLSGLKLDMLYTVVSND